MEITITPGQPLVVTLNGRLDTTNATDFELAMKPILDGDMADVVLDCSDLSYISSSGLRLFLVLQKASLTKKGNLRIRSMRPEIREVFDMTGFSSILNFE